MVTIAVIDNYPLILEALEGVLSNGGQDKSVNILLAKSITDFADNNPGLTPDLFIFGFNEDREREGILAISDIKNQYESSLLVVLDDEIRPEIAIIALRVNAMGYLSKQGDLKEFLLCVQTVLAGKRYLCSDLVKALKEYLVLMRYTLTPYKRKVHLKDSLIFTRQS